MKLAIYQYDEQLRIFDDVDKVIIKGQFLLIQKHDGSLRLIAEKWLASGDDSWLDKDQNKGVFFTRFEVVP